MHILFLTLAYPLSGKNIYTDMIDELVNQGHFVSICVQDETKNSGPFLVLYRRNICIFSIPTGKITKTSVFVKGINTLLLEYRFLRVLSRFNFKFVDVLLYSTPPITFQKIIPWLKKRYNCVSYLLLKDIFPQNAVDLGMIKSNGFLHRFFRNKERKLYHASDIIGCMSPGNVKYLLGNNCELAASQKKVNVTPNCILSTDDKKNANKKLVLEKYNIPDDVILLIYGGNIGKPQGINFLIECIKIIKTYSKVFLFVVGNGTEFAKVKQAMATNTISNVKLLDFLPNETYYELLECMDAGLVFLDNRFTIPNFPSRILDYMNYSKPIIACTDIVSDIKQEICDQGAGLWCRSNDVEGFKEILETIINDIELLINMGKKSREILLKKYSVKTVVAKILSEIKDTKKLLS